MWIVFYMAAVIICAYYLAIHKHRKHTSNAGLGRNPPGAALQGDYFTLPAWLPV